jgi:transcriptional regulator with XRE-family HTH domain
MAPRSERRTTVAVVRQETGLSVEEFADLVGKSVSAIKSIEAGRLPLSERTSADIAQKTGVDMMWLGHGDPAGPIPDFTGKLWTKQTFERVQAGELANMELAMILDIADKAWAVYRNQLLARAKDSMLRAILLNRLCLFVRHNMAEFEGKVDEPPKGPPLSLVPPSKMRKMLKDRKPKPQKAK